MIIKPRIPYLQAGHPRNRALVNAWLFSEGGGTVIRDITRFRNDGFFVNSPLWTIGRNGPAISFNGTNQSIDLGGGTALTKFSIVAWVYPTSFATFGMILVKGTANDRNYDLDIEQTTGKLRCYFTSALNTFRGFTGNTALQLNQWSHAACTFDGSTQRLYLNGRADGSNAAAFTPETTSNLRIGSTNGTGDFFAGKISEVRLFRDALTPGEIARLYESDYSEFLPSVGRIAMPLPPLAHGQSAVTIIS